MKSPQPPYPALPDRQVKQQEDHIVGAFKTGQSAGTVFTRRPGFGTRGREIQLWTNYFELTGYGDLVLYRYTIAVSVDGNVNIPSGKKLKRIIHILLDEHLDQYRPGVVTDYKSTILSKQAFDDHGHYKVGYRNEGEEDPSPNQTVYQVKLHLNAVLSMAELLNYVTSTRSAELLGSREELIQALNIVIGHHPKAASHVANVGSNAHYGLSPPGDRFDLGAGLQAIRGFFTSVRLAIARVLVNVQVKQAAFFAEGPLDGLMEIFIRDNGPNRPKLQKFLSRLSINVTHIVRRSRSGRVIPRIKQITGLAKPGDGVQQQNPPRVSAFGAGPENVQFFLAGSRRSDSKQGTAPGKRHAQASGESALGTYISVYDFFRQTYSIRIRNSTLPVVNVGTSQNPIYLPPQVCEVGGGQYSLGKLSPSQTQNMIRFAVRTPGQNATSITTTGRDLLGFEPTATTLATLGLRVDNKLLSVTGRVLDGPSVRYHGQGMAKTRFGTWNLQELHFAASKELPYWTYLAISFENQPVPWDTEGKLHHQIDAFTTKLKEVGIKTARCTSGMPLVVREADAESQIDAAVNRFMNSPNRRPPGFLLVVLPKRDARLYNRVKYACDITEGLLNVCVVASKFMKPNNDQTFANIALKVNLKLGGHNHTLADSKLGILAQEKTMVVGLDVTHASPGSANSAPSVAGIVASVDRWLGQFPGELHILPPRQEMVTGLQALVKRRLKTWQLTQKALPENILIYRDGVSESQYDQVLAKELPACRAAGKEIYSPEQTKKGISRITIVVVGKRHHTRFYPTKADDADRSSNPPNGTVVDRGITEVRNWDFFLQAHSAIQGTARPAHYFIITDEIFCTLPVKPPFANSADMLEDLTHNMCYMFGRATKAVSICPPAYYADLLCERARCYLSRMFDPEATETESTTSTQQSNQSTNMNNAVKLHPNVKDSMFYL